MHENHHASYLRYSGDRPDDVLGDISGVTSSDTINIEEKPGVQDIVNDRLKQQFFRLMSQEYRTSLTTILMSIDELEFDAMELEREEAEICHQQIRLAIEHMRHLLHEARENF